MNDLADFTAALHMAIKSLQMYNIEHPRAVTALMNVQKSATALLADRDRVSILVAKGTLLLQGKAVVGKSMHSNALAKLLDEHQFGGIVMTQGVDYKDLLTIVRVLAMRPQQVNEAGGPDQILHAAGVTHARISHVKYEAVTEGEEVVWSKSIVTRGQDVGDDKEDLPALLRKFLLNTMQSQSIGEGAGGGQPAAGTPGGAAEAGGAVTGDDAEGAGGGASEGTVGVGANGELNVSDPIAAAMLVDQVANSGVDTRDVLRDAIEGMAPEVQLALLAGISRLPSTALRDLLKPAARAILASGAIGGAAGEGGGGSDGTLAGTPGDAAETAVALGGIGGRETDYLSRLINSLPAQDRSLELLRGRLVDLGIGRDQLDEVLGVISWDNLSPEQKIEKLLSGERIFAFPAEKLLVFVHELLEDRHYGEALRVVEHYGGGLRHESQFVRKSTCQTLGQIATYVQSPGASHEIEHMLARLLLNNLLKETDRKMQETAADAVANLETAYIATGRADLALRDLGRMETTVAAAASQNPAAAEGYAALLRAFAEPKRAGTITALVFDADTETLAHSILPLVSQLGAPLSRSLVDALGEEQDRHRRGRLIRALKAIGRPAYPVLLEALEAPLWYIVRNALNVLGDIGSGELTPQVARKLKHGDERVRRAAARSLGKFGGTDAESYLVTALADNDAETQSEILLCLGAMKAQTAVPVVLDFSKHRRIAAGDDPVRESAITALGQIGSPAAVPVLSDMLRTKGRRSRGEPPRIRAAAARALAAISTPEARDAIQKALEGETDATIRDTLAKAVAHK